MYEAKPPQAVGAKAVPQPSDAGEALRRVKWGELVSRLAAARELRCENGEAASMGEASFDAESARKIARRADGKPDVNPDALANGKAAGGNEISSEDNVCSGDRGRE